MTEDKFLITTELFYTLRRTRAGKDISSLTYERTSEFEEYVNITYKDGSTKRVCVTADSGIALVWDVVKAVM